VIRILGPDASVAAVARGAHSRGEDVHVVPAGADKAESLARFGEVLHFPHGYGHNLDALADRRYDLAAGLDVPLLVVWDGVAGLREDDSPAYEAICGVLDEVAEDHAGFSATVIER
jgi:RNAse (barnase) inhibitor barstar